MTQFNRQTIIKAITAESVGYYNTQSTAVVAVGATETLNIFAPAGTIVEVGAVFGMGKAVAGSTVGTHQLLLSFAGFTLLKGITAFNKELQYNFGEWYSTVDIPFPADKGAQATVIKGMIIDSVSGFQCKYTNNTDKATDGIGMRSYSLIGKKKVIV